MQKAKTKVSLEQKQKFSSTFYKRWQIPKTESLFALRRVRNTLSFRRIFESVKTFCKRKSFHKLPDCTDYPRKVPGGKFSEVETDVGLCDNKSLSYFYINIASRIQVSAVKNHPLDNF